MAEKRLIKLTNRSDSFAGYNVPDMPAGYERDFAPGETKEVEYEEIQKLYWTPGGRKLFENYFVITDEDVLGELGIFPEPEYFYTKEDVKELLLNGSYEQLEDALQFGPVGVLDLIKDMAVDLEIPDVNKREIIKEKTGLNITLAIKFKKESVVEQPAEEKKTRRAEPVQATQRKAAPVSSKYKRVE